MVYWTTGILCMTLLVVGCSHPQGHTRTVEELELASQNSQKEIERLRKAAQETSQKLAIQEAKIEELQAERDTLAQDVQHIQQATEENERLQTAVEETTQQLAKQEQQVAKLEGERDALVQEIEQLQSQKNREAELFEQVKKEREAIEHDLTEIAKTFEEQIGDALHVQQEKDRIILTVLGRALFDSGYATLNPVGVEVMQQVGQVLSRFPEKYIQVEGHTDNVAISGRLRDTYPTNWELSTARATTVLRYFIDETGLDASHFAAVGYAETRPVVSNETEKGRAQNRRVEIVLYPKNVFMPEKTPLSPSS